jgi:aminopeptidase N
MKKQLQLLLIAITIVSCNVFKKTNNTSKNNLPVINLDTVKVSAKTPEPQQYQASFTKLTDLIHTKLEVSFDWDKQIMFGKATITARPYFYPTSQLVLDARVMEIKEVSLIKKEFVTTVSKNVKQDNTSTSSAHRKIYEPLTTTTDTITSKVPLKYTYEKDILTINLDKEYKNTDQYTVFIDYIAHPNDIKKGGGSAAINDDKGLYFINPDGKEKDKPKQIWTQGETQSNSVWFPTIDHPNEKQTDEIYITVDKKYTTLSNGELVSTSDNADGTRTDYWRMDLPHSTYLMMMAIGEFAVVKDHWCALSME